MPAVTDTGPFDNPPDLTDRIRSEPDTVEPGLRLVDLDLDAGLSGGIDLLGVDRHGVLTLIAVATRTPEEALSRLLDGYLWATDQYALLVRVCSLERVGHAAGSGHRPDIRMLLLAPGFSHPFLRRLTLLKPAITPLLARLLPLRAGSQLLVEPAAQLFGLQMEDRPTRDDAPPIAEPRSFDAHFADRAIEEVLPPERSGEEAAEDGPEHLPPIDVPVASLLTPADRELFTETLSAEELEAFERFEQQRRGEDGGLE